MVWHVAALGFLRQRQPTRSAVFSGNAIGVGALKTIASLPASPNFIDELAPFIERRIVG